MPGPLPTGHSRRSSARALAGLLAVLFVGWLDWKTGSEISFSIFYLLPIALVLWSEGLEIGIVVAVSAAVVWFTVDQWHGTQYSHPFIPYWNAFVRLLFFLLVTVLLDRSRQLTANLESIVKRRTAALEAEIAQRKELEREVAQASQMEQERLAYELHDRMGAYLTGLAFRVKTLADRLGRRGATEAAEAESLVEQVNQATDQVRSLAHMLAPASDPQDGLGPALFRLGRKLEKVFDVACLVDVDKVLPALTSEQRAHLYHIAQEAARNGIVHGKAAALEITLNGEADHVVLTIRNNGNSWTPVDATREGLGLRIMRYRTAILDGVLTLETGENSGASVTCRVPIRSERPGSETAPDRQVA